jgi:hypothetical protein
MPSPFPGMNPWLEQEGLWQDFHTKFLTAINERLVQQVRPRYVVILEQHLFIHELPAEDESIRRAGRADLSLVRPLSEAGGGGAIGGAVLEAPAEVQLVVPEVERVPYLEIRDRRSREIVCVVEMLSPSNKRGEDRRQYLAKREDLLHSAAHLVEIDFLRGGRAMPLTHRPDCAYSVLVSRVEARPLAGFWPIPLRQRLPVIPIPLRKPDGDATIDLQETLDRVYDAYGYEDFLYEGSPDPPLSAEDEPWSRPFRTAIP